jgi:hypothetical protein
LSILHSPVTQTTSNFAKLSTNPKRKEEKPTKKVQRLFSVDSAISPEVRRSSRLNKNISQSKEAVREKKKLKSALSVEKVSNRTESDVVY